MRLLEIASFDDDVTIDNVGDELEAMVRKYKALYHKATVLVRKGDEHGALSNLDALEFLETKKRFKELGDKIIKLRLKEFDASNKARPFMRNVVQKAVYFYGTKSGIMAFYEDGKTQQISWTTDERLAHLLARWYNRGVFEPTGSLELNKIL